MIDKGIPESQAVDGCVYMDRFETGDLSRRFRQIMQPSNKLQKYLLLHAGLTQSIVNHLLGFAHDGVQMRLTLEALSVDLVNVLGPRRTRGKPTIGRNNLQSADGSAIARS